MRTFKVMTAAVFLASTSAYAGSLPPVEKTFSSSVSENRERLSLHNRCMAAATYAMLDDSYPEEESKAEYYRHRDAREAIIRHVSPEKRMAFISKVPTIRDYQSVFQNLQWGTRMKALIKEEFEGCKTI